MANGDSMLRPELVTNSGVRPRRWLLMTLFISVMATGATALADTWLLPTKQQYFSTDKQIRFQVTPRELNGQLDYFQDKVVGKKEQAGQNPNGAALASGKLEIRERNAWRVLWERALVNDVSPTRALVANRGTHVVTFDNWHSVGFGNDVVVIYDAAGKLVRAMGLKDFLPEDYVQALPRSVSSIHWGLAHHLADKDGMLVLQIVVPPEDGGMHQEEPAFIEVRVRLADGVVVPPSGPAWEQAQAAAVRSLATQRAEMEAFRAKRAETITAPANDEQAAWRDYLTEMMVRRSTGVEDFPRLFFLPAERDPDYLEDRERMLETLSTGIRERFNPGTQIVFSSPSSVRLAELMEQGLAKVPENSLHGYTIVFAGEQQSNAVVEIAVRRTGSNYVFVNVREPIPGQVWPSRQPEEN